MCATRNILDEVFAFDDEEENKETFMESVRKNMDPEGEEDPRFDSTESYSVEVPKLMNTSSGFVRIMHGIDDRSYVWHIAPNHPKKKWKVRPEQFFMAIHKVMSKVIPPKTRVWIWGPEPSWEIPEWTFKAVDLMDEWSVSEEDINKMVIELLEVLNALL